MALSVAREGFLGRKNGFQMQISAYSKQGESGVGKSRSWNLSSLICIKQLKILKFKSDRG